MRKQLLNPLSKKIFSTRSQLSLLLAVVLTSLCVTPAQALDRYTFYLCGTQVTSDNMNSLADFCDLKSGTISYEPTSNTLTLTNAIIETSSSRWLDSNGNTLTLVVNGKCSITGAYTPIFLRGNVHIKGAGNSPYDGNKLTLSGDAYGILVTKDHCTISNLSLKSEGYYGGISGTDIKGNALIINNALVRAEGSYGSIRAIDSLAMNGCKIFTPEGAIYDNGDVKINGNTVTSEVLIAPNDYSTSIKAAEVNEPLGTGIYTIDGVRLDIPFEQLPRGIYIVDGKKTLKP